MKHNPPIIFFKRPPGRPSEWDLPVIHMSFSIGGGGKGGIKLEKVEKEKKIKSELNKLKKLFKDLEKDKVEFANRLMQQASFMYVTLLELQERINEEGSVELFEQGSQKMIREHPAVKSYNSMIKNYNATIKQLNDLLPKNEVKAKVDDGFNDFVSSRRD